MSFSIWPPVWARRLRYIMCVAYVFLLYTGLVTYFFTPNTVEGVAGYAIMVAWAGAAMLAGLAGIYGTLRNEWRKERWAAPLGTAAVSCYAISIWILVFTEGAWTRQTQAGALTTLAILLLFRAVELAATANRDRVRRQKELSRIANGE